MEIIPKLVPSLLMTIPFLIAFAGLHFILFKPLLEYIEGRDTQTSKARREAHEYRAKVDDKLDLLQEQLADARAQAAEVRADARARAQVKEHALLAEARKKAEERVSGALVEIRSDKERAAAELEAMASQLSQDIATKVLGREVNA